MKTPKNQTGNGQSIVPVATSLKLRLAMVIGWSLLTLLLAITMVAQPAQAQRVEPGQLPSSITMTRSVKYGHNAMTFNINAPHSVFYYYDKVEAENCWGLRNRFEYYVADPRNDDEEIRQSGKYTLYQRSSSKKLCILVTFGDYRQGGAAGYGYGPFSFDQSQIPITPIDNNQSTTPITPPENTNNPPVVIKKTISGTVDYDQDLELPDGSKMVIELQNTSAQDATSPLVAKKTLTNLGNPPHSFTLSYNPKDIKELNTYSIQVEVVDSDGNRLLHSDALVNVITHNNPTDVNISLVPTRHLTQLQPEDIEDQTDNSQEETEEETEPPAQRFKRPLPIQTKKSQRATESPQPEEKATDSVAPKETTEDASQEPEAPAEQTTEPATAEQSIPITIVIEEPLVDPVTNPPVTEHQTNKLDNGGSDLIWLGAYIVAVLVVGAISLLLLNRKDR